VITFSPLLSWKSLIRIFFLSSVNDVSLARPWCEEGESAFWFSKTAWSLVAITMWWEKMLHKSPIIWVPGYFCNQSLWPLRQYGGNRIKFVFYPVKDKFRPDWDACDLLAQTEKPDIFILTHFYGLISDVKKSKEFCDQHNALFVEDAAHVILPFGEIGLASHFVLYSPHKFFAISQGALCIMRSSTKDYVEKNQVGYIEFESIRALLGGGYYPFLKWAIRQIIKNFTRNFFSHFKKIVPYELDGAHQPMPTATCMHPFAKKLLFLEQKKIPIYIEHRKKCAKVWEEIIVKRKIPMERVFNADINEIPYVAVFNSLNNEAKIIYNTLTKNKWPATSWPDLPPEVRKDEKLHASTIHFRNNMIIFPVNQSLKIKELIKKYGSLGK